MLYAETNAKMADATFVRHCETIKSHIIPFNEYSAKLEEVFRKCDSGDAREYMSVLLSSKFRDYFTGISNFMRKSPQSRVFSICSLYRQWLGYTTALYAWQPELDYLWSVTLPGGLYYGILHRISPFPTISEVLKADWVNYADLFTPRRRRL